MIPKVIHYCWFGHNKKSELIEKCIASWYEYCPDYKIIEWNEDNFDVNSIPYVRDTYTDKNGHLSPTMRDWQLFSERAEYILIQMCTAQIFR